MPKPNNSTKTEPNKVGTTIEVGTTIFTPTLQEQAFHRVMERQETATKVAKDFGVSPKTVKDWVRSQILANVALGIQDDAEIRTARYRIQAGIDRLLARYMPIALGEASDGETAPREAAIICERLFALMGKIHGVIKISPHQVNKLQLMQINHQINSGPMSDEEILAQSQKALPALLSALRPQEASSQ